VQPGRHHGELIRCYQCYLLASPGNWARLAGRVLERNAAITVCPSSWVVSRYRRASRRCVRVDIAQRGGDRPDGGVASRVYPARV